MLVWNCLNGWCQSNQFIPLRGKDTIVNVRIDLIRRANVKLIEHRHCVDIISTKDTIINLERNKFAIMDSIYRVNYINCYNNIKSLEREVSKVKRRNKILGGTVVGSIAIVVLTLLVK